MDEHEGHDHEGHDHGEEDFSTEDVVNLTEDKVDALLTLLIKKKIITEEELGKAMDELYDDKEE